MNILRTEICKHLPREGEARRLFHGRGHCFAGGKDVVIDCYPPVVLVTLYAAPELAWLEQLGQLLRQQLPGTEAILLQQRFLPGAPSRMYWGSLPATVEAREAGLRYRLRLGQGQNIGFFLDMAVGRSLVRKGAAGKRVLNLFAYSCSFSVAALAGGATQVINLDMNRGALELGRENHLLNGLDPRRASFLPLELFRSLGKLRRLGPFDLIICDPPSIQGKSFSAGQHWPKLIRRLPELLAPGGEVLACLSSPHLAPSFLDALFAELIPAVTLLGSYRPGPDFPEAEPDRGLNLRHYRIP